MSAAELCRHYHFNQAFSFTRLVEAYQPDYLHSYFFYEGTLFTFIASYLLGIPRGVTCYADHMLSDYDLKVVPLHLQTSHLIVATSRRIKHELMELNPQIDADRILVKPNGIDSTQFPLVTVDDPVAGQPYRLICVSRLEPKKGLVYLVDAVRRLRDRNCHVEVDLLGGVDNSEPSRQYAAQLEASIRIHALEPIMHLRGWTSQSDIKRLFGRAHLFVAPFIETDYGDKDGIPTSVLEAMAAGLAIVATDAGSIPEAIEHERDGLIVPQRDPQALAEAIAGLLADRPRRVRLGRQAAATVRSTLDVSVCEPLFHDRLTRLLSSRALVQNC
jgi:glycosyltransferase involved in cell wall biosynthesis